ncbi:MAG: Kelch repeat-containing protein [Glycocaulis sp.]
MHALVDWRLSLTALSLALAMGLCAPAGAAEEEAGEILAAAPSGLMLRPGWQPGPQLDSARAGLGAVVLDGRIYAAGGAGRVNPRDNFEMLEPGLNRWLSLSALPEGLERFGIAAADGRIWVAGGYSAESGRGPIASMWSYDPESDVWQSEPPMPAARSAFALIGVEGRLYAVGGADEPGGVFVFDLEAREWSTLDAPAGVRRRDAGVALAGRDIWFTGGIENRRAVTRVDIFNLDSQSWRSGPALPEARAGHALVHDGQRLLALGGRGEDLRSTRQSVATLIPGAAGWQAHTPLPAARTEAAAVSLEGVVYVIGGGVGGGFFAPFTALDSVDILAPGQ